MSEFTREYIIKYLENKLSDGERKDFVYEMYLDEDLEKEVDKLVLEIGLYSTPFQENLKKEKRFGSAKTPKQPKIEKPPKKQKKGIFKIIDFIKNNWRDNENLEERQNKAQRVIGIRLLKTTLYHLLEKNKIKEIFTFLEYVLKDNSQSKIILRNYLINIANDLSMSDVSPEMISVNSIMIRDYKFRERLNFIIMDLGEKELKKEFYETPFWYEFTEEDIITYIPN